MPFQGSFSRWGNPVCSHRCFLFATRHKTARAFGQGPRTHTILDLYSRSLSRPLFQKHFSNILCSSLCFRFCSVLLKNSSIDSSSTFSKRVAIVAKLQSLRHFCLPAVARRFLKVIFPLWSDNNKKAFCLDHNFALYVIKIVNRHPLV